jgi:hypothetical protein
LMLFFIGYLLTTTYRLKSKTMRLENIVEGNEYILSHAYGKKEQKVVVLSVNIPTEKVLVQYVSNDVSKGMTSNMNRIECERYLHEN